jgi:hypothetical protein
MVYEDRAFLQKLRAEGLRRVPEITWGAAGVKLLQVYRETIAAYADAKSKTKAKQWVAGARR